MAHFGDLVTGCLAPINVIILPQLIITTFIVYSWSPWLHYPFNIVLRLMPIQLFLTCNEECEVVYNMQFGETGQRITNRAFEYSCPRVIFLASLQLLYQAHF